MTVINDVYEYLCELAPLSLQMEFDNSGFQLGRGRAEVRRVLLALDVTDAVADEAIRLGAQLIVSHHPLIFNGPKCISDADPGTERLLSRLRAELVRLQTLYQDPIAEKNGF